MSGRLSSAVEFSPGAGGWQDAALCATTDPDMWFPEKGKHARKALKVCAGCPVRAECLAFALAQPSNWGVWGGYTERQLRRMRRA